MVRHFPAVPSSRTVIGGVVSVLALFPNRLTRPGLRFLDDPLLSNVIAVVISELSPLAGLGFLFLGLYFAVSYATAESPEDRSHRLATICGLGLGVGYAWFSLAIWINPGHIDTMIILGSRWVTGLALNSPLTFIVEPAVLFDIHSVLRSAAREGTTLFRRPFGRPVRWPFYFFVTFITVTAISDSTDWLASATTLDRLIVRLICAIIALIFGLIIVHNFFPGVDTLPWRSNTMGVWLLAHTSISAGTLWLIRPLTNPESRPPLPSVLVILLLIGGVIAVLDGLYPLPELLLLGGATLVMIERKTSLGASPVVEPRALDIESRIIDTISAAWTDSSRLFVLLIAFQGFFLSGWLLWALLFSATSPLTRMSDIGILSAGVVLLILFPLIAASGYLMWFWVGEIQRLSKRTATWGNRLSRPPDLLVFPTVTVGGFLTFDTLVGIHPIAGLLAILCILGGFGAMIWSVSRLRHRVTLPNALADHAVLVAFLIQMGGFELWGTISPTQYGPEASYLALLLILLVPLYFYPRLRHHGIRGWRPFLTSTALVMVVLVGGILYVSGTAVLPVLTSSVLGVSAVGLAVIQALTDGIARLQ